VENRHYGIYRAMVIDNKDEDMFGRVKVWIPDVMPTVDPSIGVWARPGNNPIGGRNAYENSSHHYAGTSYIPLKGSWILVFFEGGNVNRPYYLSALDIEHTKVLPENQKGSNYELKWTIFKSHMGRCIVISDDEDDERVEITSKKRKLKTPPTGDLDSVYEIDGNQTTILLDERDGKEKVLIRTHKGDFFHIDIDEQQLHAYFKSDIHILTDANFYLKSKGDMHLKSDQSIFVASKKDTHVNATENLKLFSNMNTDIKANMNLNIQGTMALNILVGTLMNIESYGAMNIKSGMALSIESLVLMNIKSSGVLNTDGTIRSDQMKLAMPAGPASPATISTIATDANPVGERDT